MKIKPLAQLREMISKALSGQTNLSKSFQSFFIEAMELFLTIPNRINFLQMWRFGRSSEQRFRMNFRKKFDWISFNRTLVHEGNPNRRAIAIDPSYISKSGKKTPGVGYFWSGCASAVKWGLELMDFAFNMSLSTINVARQFGKGYGMDLSVSDVKLLLHNAAMVERIFSTFGKSPNLMKNNTDFKELLFYGLRAAI